MFTIQFIRATFWLLSVGTATLKSKHESTESSEVALTAVAFFLKTKRSLETTFCSDFYIHFRRQHGKTYPEKR